MLPFLKPKNIGSTIIAAKQKKSGAIESEGPKEEKSPELMAACESLISAIHMKDATAAANAFEAAFKALESKEDSEEVESNEQG